MMLQHILFGFFCFQISKAIYSGWMLSLYLERKYHKIGQGTSARDGSGILFFARLIGQKKDIADSPSIAFALSKGDGASKKSDLKKEQNLMMICNFILLGTSIILVTLCMQVFGFHPRLMRFFLIVFGANLIISIVTQFNKPAVNTGAWLINLFFPSLFALAVGSVLGLFIFLIPQKGYETMQRLLRSKLIGVMIVTFLWFVYHIYHLLHKMLIG